MVAELGIQVSTNLRVDITHVDAPSSTMHQCMTKFRIDIRILKEMVDGIYGSPFSMSNVIKLESEGSTTPRAASKDFRCVGQVLSTSREDMAVGVWAKSSMMLQLTAALAMVLLVTRCMGGHEKGGN